MLAAGPVACWCSLCLVLKGGDMVSEGRLRTLLPMSHRPASSEPPHAMVSSMMVLPARVPMPTDTCMLWNSQPAPCGGRACMAWS